jgi:molybdopterin converting factor small subunit
VNIQTLFFGHYRDFAPESLTLEVPPGTSVAEVAGRFAEKDSRFADLIKRTRVAVNGEFASPDCMLSEGDEVAFLPPMSGG